METNDQILDRLLCELKEKLSAAYLYEITEFMYEVKMKTLSLPRSQAICILKEHSSQVANRFNIMVSNGGEEILKEYEELVRITREEAGDKNQQERTTAGNFLTESPSAQQTVQKAIALQSTTVTTVAKAASPSYASCLLVEEHACSQLELTQVVDQWNRILRSDYYAQFLKHLDSTITRFKADIDGCLLKFEIKSIALPLTPSAYHQLKAFIKSLRNGRTGCLSYELGSSKDSRNMRNKRFGASEFARYCSALKLLDSSAMKLFSKMITSNTPATTVSAGSSKFSGEARKHGLDNEQKAMEMYAKITGNEVKESGYWIRCDYPWLIGKPDGLVKESSSSDTGLLEIKCPFSARDRKLKDYAAEHRDTFFLVTNDLGELKLREGHDYYFQIQGYLFICRMKWCDFFVFTFEDHFRQRIYRDDNFCNSMALTLTFVYFRFVLPSLVEGTKANEPPSNAYLVKVFPPGFNQTEPQVLHKIMFNS